MYVALALVSVYLIVYVINHAKSGEAKAKSGMSKMMMQTESRSDLSAEQCYELNKLTRDLMNFYDTTLDGRGVQIAYQRLCYYVMNNIADKEINECLAEMSHYYNLWKCANAQCNRELAMKYTNEFWNKGYNKFKKKCYEKCKNMTPQQSCKKFRILPR